MATMIIRGRAANIANVTTNIIAKPGGSQDAGRCKDDQASHNATITNAIRPAAAATNLAEPDCPCRKVIVAQIAKQTIATSKTITRR